MDTKDEKKPTYENTKETKSDNIENKFKKAKTLGRNFSKSKYKSYSSKNSIIKADSDLHSYKINSNNFFKPSQDALNGKKTKLESSNNQSSNLITTSQMNMIDNSYNHFMLYPLEFFENNKFALINSYGYSTEPGVNFNQTPKINQDCFLLMKNIFGYQNFYILSVLDGHGNFFLIYIFYFIFLLNIKVLMGILFLIM